MPKLTEVVFLSQAWAEAYIPRSAEALVSITDHGAAQANLNDGWSAVLRVSFDDVDPIESPLEPEEDLIEMQEQEAERIAGFVRSNSQRVGTLVVHCRYGQSRSNTVNLDNFEYDRNPSSDGGDSWLEPRRDWVTGHDWQTS